MPALIQKKRPEGTTAAEFGKKFGRSADWVRHHIAQPREEYEKYSIQAIKPWTYFNYSFMTWYRKKKPQPPADWLEARKLEVEREYQSRKTMSKSN